MRLAWQLHLRGDLAEQGRELTRPVRAAHGEAEVPAGSRQAVLDHPEHQQRIDVAAGEHRHHRRGHLDHPGQQGGDADRASRLDHLLVPLQQHQQRPGAQVRAHEGPSLGHPAHLEGG